MKHITIILISIFLFTGCQSTNNTSKEKTFVGVEQIEEGATFFGTHISHRGNHFCKYIGKFGDEIYVKKEHNEKCAKK